MFAFLFRYAFRKVLSKHGYVTLVPFCFAVFINKALRHILFTVSPFIAITELIPIGMFSLQNFRLQFVSRDISIVTFTTTVNLLWLQKIKI